MLHKFSMNGLFFVLDINSGAIHTVDELTYFIIDDYKLMSEDEIARRFKSRFPLEDILEAINEIRTLEGQGMLFSPDAHEIAAKHALRSHESFLESKAPIVKALCLHVSHDCNLRCKYCFASKGGYSGRRQLMASETGKRAIDFLIASSGSRRNLEVDFFGGEPTLNFEAVKEIVAYGRSREKESGKNIRFTLTTNGVLLESDMMEFIDKNMTNVVLSIDGRKEVNDEMRISPSGKGSYEHIVDRLRKMADMRGQTGYYVRGTYTRQNLDFSEDVLHLADLGFKQVSVEPVVSPQDEPYSLRKEDLPALFEQYERLADKMEKRRKEGKPFNFFHFNIDLTGGPCLIKRLTGCGAGTEYLAVTPQGDLYPCHQFVGMEEFKLGDITGGIDNVKLRGEFARCNVYAKEECLECWAKFYCSGGCAANAYHQNGSILKPYELGCELQKKRIECALYLASTEMLEEAEA
ncbi:MAG: thioether cross-link-forming SCIFF peptide maturase [Clostridiales bacterium]|jgi:uncharacterized protein|nr:thioether cross-link-forming SCIFF peptide maturase [Clostridiales bacterium]